jgi:hypothetical protein
MNGLSTKLKMFNHITRYAPE